MIDASFGRLEEAPPREIVLGVAGMFWRATGNVQPFRRQDFDGPVAPGLARAVWNFALRDAGDGHTLLSTETRVVCGDPGSRQKFRLYWRVVGPFSGLIRRSMLRAIRRQAIQMGGPDMAPQSPQRSEAPRPSRGAPRQRDRG